MEADLVEMKAVVATLKANDEQRQASHEALQGYCDYIRVQNEELQFKVERMDHVISTVKTMFVGKNIKNICPVCHENIRGSQVQCNNVHFEGQVCDFCMCRLEAVRDENDILMVTCPVCREIMVMPGDLHPEERD